MAAILPHGPHEDGHWSGLAQRLELQHWMEEEKAWSLPLSVPFAGLVVCWSQLSRLDAVVSLSNILRLHTAVFSLHVSDRNSFVPPSVTLGS